MRGLVDSLVDDLRDWPPPVERWIDERVRARFAPVLAPDCPRPSWKAIRKAFQLAAWEMEREYEAIDEFYRNDRAAEVTSDDRERLALVFLHRWLTDSLLEVLEATDRLKRPQLVECLAQTEARLLSQG